jgi:hypothetical protein
MLRTSQSTLADVTPIAGRDHSAIVDARGLNENASRTATHAVAHILGLNDSIPGGRYPEDSEVNLMYNQLDSSGFPILLGGFTSSNQAGRQLTSRQLQLLYEAAGRLTP